MEGRIQDMKIEENSQGNYKMLIVQAGMIKMTKNVLMDGIL